MSAARVFPATLALIAARLASAAPQDAPPLIEAAESGDRVAVSRLLDRGAAVDARAVDGTTALHWAVRSERLDTVRALLESGADASAADRYGVTPLYLAAENGNADVIAALLDRGADVDARDPEFEQTALMLAVREAHPEVVALLLDRGADVDARTRIGPTPKFVPPCKGTGCGSEGVGINRGGLPDRG